MPKPKKYDNDLYGPQRAYFKTEKGKAALKRAQRSEKEKERKRQWWRKNKAKNDSPKILEEKSFIDTYVDFEQAFELLEDQEQEVINYYYGLNDRQPMNLTAIAQMWDKSVSRISQIKKSALAKLESQKQAKSS